MSYYRVLLKTIGTRCVVTAQEISVGDKFTLAITDANGTPIEIQAIVESITDVCASTKRVKFI